MLSKIAANNSRESATSANRFIRIMTTMMKTRGKDANIRWS